MKNLLSILFISLLLASCSNPILKEARKKDRANKALERLVKKFPNLAKTDTTLIHDTILVKGAAGDTVIMMNNDLSGLDSLFLEMKADLKSGMDSTRIHQLQQNVNNYITHRQVLSQDTFTWFVDTVGLTIQVYEENGALKMKYILNDKYINHTTEVVTQQVMEAQKTMIENAVQKIWGMGRFWLIILVVVFVLYFAWSILKKFFPVLDIFS